MSFIAFTPGLAEGEQEGSFLLSFELHGAVYLLDVNASLILLQLLYYNIPSLPPPSIFAKSSSHACCIKREGFFVGVSLSTNDQYTQAPLSQSSCQ
jgi:hypothetical protein